MNFLYTILFKKSICLIPFYQKIKFYKFINNHKIQRCGRGCGYLHFIFFFTFLFLAYIHYFTHCSKKNVCIIYLLSF